MRYYFDILDNDGFHHDATGDEFTSFDEARTQAQALVPDIIREEMPDGDLHTVRCYVRNASGKVVYRGELTYRGTRYDDRAEV